MYGGQFFLFADKKGAAFHGIPDCPDCDSYFFNPPQAALLK